MTDTARPLPDRPLRGRPLRGRPLPERPLRIAAAQARPAAGDVAANAATTAAMIREAAASGARLVVFPEKFLTGYEPELIRAEPLRCAVQGDGDARLAPVTAACRETGTVAVVGAAVHDGGELYVSALVIGADGALVTRYDKQTLFKAEREVYRQGARGASLELGGWRLGLGICYDSGFPEHARAAALDGCHAYVVGALFGVGNGHHESRTWFPARALDNTVYAVLANHVGETGGRQACGGSAVWAPDGRLVAEASPDRPGLLVADLDPAVLRTARDAEPMLRDLHDTAAARRDEHLLGG
ncbi:carbon-nitrogen hydrolase family protein [Streptomyces sp. FIT100]|uniref:carbon-nitrogen hydrolase family protein n=1 Tax=Streptomyces sp. FIT100 TaxID=2837956 RepID=UPI0021C6081C|nr:carbon-nitrogen hydrolase family protein [Streptomyces sp. FIT100]